MKEEKCQFDKDGICYAYGCYSSQNCSAKDKENNPKYADIEKIKRGGINEREEV